MQKSQSFIATHRVSLSAYQRLRSTLMQQSTAFESVMTEAQFEAQFADDVLRALGADEQVAADDDSDADGREALCFVVMRSPTLSVLMAARPILNPVLNQGRPIPDSHHLNASVNDDLSRQRGSIHRDLSYQHRQSKHGQSKHRQSRQFSQNGQSPHLQIDTDLIESRSDQSIAPLDRPEYSTTLTQDSRLEAGKSEVVGPPQLLAYEVSLTFDETVISSFVGQLMPNGAATHQTTSSARASQGTSTAQKAWLSPPQAVAQSPSIEALSGRANTSSPNTSPQSSPTKTVARVKALNQERFALSWAKQLANAPDSSTQTILNKQIQQSLLLNQVITRIRHSLDLPAILETTVAQVREFLSADRLVLYQFEQLEAMEFSSPSATDPLPKGNAELPPATVHREQAGRGDGSPVKTSPVTDLQMTGQATSSDTIIGRWTHDGHITYESRVSESIPSVLNVSEAACFMPSLSIRSRYIMGQPTAIDDVEKHYAHSECLLDFLRQAQVKSKMIAPIIVQDELWGLLIAHQCEDYRCWQETEAVFLQHIAEHLAVAISQAGLYQQLQKQTDSLKNRVVERTQNLHDALIAAESADLTKGEFLSTMSHELRTPLTYIIGMSATLLRWSFGELSERQRSYLNTINHSGEQLLDIINNILDFAKISSGRAFLDVSEFSLNSLVQEVMALFQSVADKQEVTLSLRFDVASAQDTFHADTERLLQILSNLVHNAIKFTPAGGSVTLRVMRDEQEAVFQVEDTGIGISESQRGLLFEKFKQLESPFQRQYSGTGLGLAMTKRLVELHGGTIQVKSAVGKGSVFSVRLPFQTPERDSEHYQVPRTFLDSSKRILLLEVQENSAAIICDLLTADGYEVIWQEDVEKMLSQLVSLQPAILIADLSLLSHDLDEIKKMQRSITDIGTKVLALLGQPMSQSSHIAHHDTLTKPIDPKTLLEKVRQLTLSPM